MLLQNASGFTEGDYLGSSHLDMGAVQYSMTIGVVWRKST